MLSCFCSKGLACAYGFCLQPSLHWRSKRMSAVKQMYQYLKYLTTTRCLDLQHSHACCNVTSEATIKLTQHVSQVAELLQHTETGPARCQHPSNIHPGPQDAGLTLAQRLHGAHEVLWFGLATFIPFGQFFSMSFTWPMVQINQRHSLVLQHLEERVY